MEDMQNFRSDPARLFLHYSPRLLGMELPYTEAAYLSAPVAGRQQERGGTAFSSCLSPVGIGSWTRWTCWGCFSSRTFEYSYEVRRGTVGPVALSLSAWVGSSVCEREMRRELISQCFCFHVVRFHFCRPKAWAFWDSTSEAAPALRSLPSFPKDRFPSPHPRLAPPSLVREASSPVWGGPFQIALGTACFETGPLSVPQVHPALLPPVPPPFMPSLHYTNPCCLLFSPISSHPACFFSFSLLSSTANGSQRPSHDVRAAQPIAVQGLWIL